MHFVDNYSNIEYTCYTIKNKELKGNYTQISEYFEKVCPTFDSFVYLGKGRFELTVETIKEK